MREVKFRAWDKKNKMIVTDDENDESRYLDGIIGTPVGMVNYWLNDKYTLDDYVFMQYTGFLNLYDKDICEDRNGNRFMIMWSELFHGWCYVYYLGDCREYLLYKLIQRIGDFKVLGNIYENPELLGGIEDE